jgi:heme oxygenase (biliverdin-IX-beta and delta-forming)
MQARKMMSSSANIESILPRLRGETQPSHARLERRVDIMNRVRTPSDYRTLLEIFYGLYQPLESEIVRSIHQIAPWLPDIGNRLRTPSLKVDLRVLGNVCPEALPLASVPPLQTLSEIFGCLYVLEGSTLGGQIISRQIGSHLGFTPENGCSFFACHGAETGNMWRKFGDAIEAYAVSHPEGRVTMIRAATNTFSAFANWFQEKS